MHFSKTEKSKSQGFLDNNYLTLTEGDFKVQRERKQLTGKSGFGPLWVSGMDPLVRPRASTLKVNAAIPLPFPAILVSQIFLKFPG